MPVTIQFDNLKDLQAFLEGREVKIGTTTRRKSSARKSTATKPTAKTTRKPAAKKAGVKKTTARKTSAKKPAAKKPAARKTGGAKGRPKAEGSLTSKIQDTIKKFIDNKQSFTANDIYDDLSQRDK